MLALGVASHNSCCYLPWYLCMLLLVGNHSMDRYSCCGCGLPWLSGCVSNSSPANPMEAWDQPVSIHQFLVALLPVLVLDGQLPLLVFACRSKCLVSLLCSINALLQVWHIGIDFGLFALSCCECMQWADRWRLHLILLLDCKGQHNKWCHLLLWLLSHMVCHVMCCIRLIALVASQMPAAALSARSAG